MCDILKGREKCEDTWGNIGKTRPITDPDYADGGDYTDSKLCGGIFGKITPMAAIIPIRIPNCVEGSSVLLVPKNRGIQRE
jgi:hypothetical protein